jgi:flagellar hook-basal body complex protein FliE
MSVIPALRATQALSVYQSVDGGEPAQGGIGGGITAGADDFAGLLTNALGSAIQTGQQAESQAIGAINGSGDLTQVVTAVSRAELALQTTVAVRDRVLQAYQDIIKMSI